MRRWHGVLVSACALALVAAACGTETKEGPSLSIGSPASGASLKGNVVPLDVTVGGIAIRKADGDTSGASGHFHVFIDRDPVSAGTVIPKEPGIVHSTEDPILVTGLSPGSHRLVVVLGDGAHARIGSVQREVTVTTEGPNVKASVVGTPAAGAPFEISVKVEGATIVKADGDTSGSTGHLHVFIDRDPTPAGQPIPKEEGIIHTTDTTIEIPALPAGDHTIWVVLGDGTHTPIAGPVEDRLKLTL